MKSLLLAESRQLLVLLDDDAGVVLNGFVMWKSLTSIRCKIDSF